MNIELVKKEIEEAKAAFIADQTKIDLLNSMSCSEAADYLFGEADFVEAICKKHGVNVTENPDLRDTQHELIREFAEL